MKKRLINLLVLSVLLTIFSSIYIIINGQTYTVKFNINNDEKYKIVVDDDDGAIKVIDEKIEKDKHFIMIKGVKPGIANIYMDYGLINIGHTVYVHKTKIITGNNFFGYSKGSEVIPISLSIILLYLLYILIKRFKECVKQNIYQYKNVAYLGIIIFTLFFTVRNIISIFNYNGLFDTIEGVINSTITLSLSLFPLVLFAFILVTISNIRLIIKEGISFKNILGLVLGIFICLSTILPDRIYMFILRNQIIDIFNLNSPGPYVYKFFETLLNLVIGYLECVLIGTIVMALVSLKKKKEYNKDYIIILGSKIKKDGTLTPLLKGRVDVALKFREEQLKKTGKDLIFIPSGGKGNDEVMSEALAMKNYLIEKGIKEENILIDDKSKNTYENIKFSNRLINNKKANIVFATTKYHVFRAGLIATKQGLIMDGIGSNTKTYFWINAFVREFIGTLYFEKKKHIIVFITVTIFLMLMILITYFANNI